MDKKSAISQRKTENPKNPLQKALKNVTHETFKIDNSDFPSLKDISVKTRNPNKTSSECNKTSFSYSDRLKAPPQESASNLFKIEKEFNDFNKNECSSQHPQLLLPTSNLSQNKPNTKNQFQSNSDASEKQAHKSPGSNNYVPNNQTSFVAGSSQLHNKCSQQKNVESNSNVHISEEGSSDAEGWILYHKHSSNKHTHDKYRGRNNPIKDFTTDSKVAERASESTYPKYEKLCNSTDKNQSSSRHCVSKAYNTTSKGATCRLDIHREVPYNNNARDKSKDSKANHEVCSVSPSKQTSNKMLKSDDRTKMKTYNNISANYSPGNPRVNNFRDKSKFPGQSSNTTQNEMFKQMPHNKQQMHNRNGIPNKNTLRNEYPCTSLNHSHPYSEDQASSHLNKGQHSDQTLTDSTVTKAKKKRKSKIKRQAAHQTGKIFILTPEAHSKILNQANSSSVKSQSNAVTNINDDEEYPELGIGAIPKSNKEPHVMIGEGDLKVELPFSSSDNVLQVENNEASASQSSINKDIIESSGLDVKAEKAINTEAEITNVPVHSSNQITVSLFDMLLTKKSKKKEIEDKVLEEDASIEHSPIKVRTKKVLSQPVNPLASSKPTVKRGKEREQPKAKKPSKMRKLILMGRKIKKENIALKDTDVHINDQSDADTDALSDGSTLSPSKSPVYGEADLHDFNKNNSLEMNVNVLEDKPHHSLSLNLHKLRENLEINVMQENYLFENNQVQTIENKDDICVKSTTLDMYFTTLIQSIINDCMDEIRSRQSKVSVEKKVDIVNIKEDISTDIIQHKFPINVKNKIDIMCDNLAESILDMCLSELNKLQNGNVSCLNLSEKSTSEDNSLSGHNFSMVVDTALMSESIKSNIEESSRDNCCDINDTKSTNASEKSGQVRDTKAVSMCTLNCSSVINSECELKISDVKLQPLSLNLKKPDVQVNTELPQSKFSDQEKIEAAKILLHTRRFRDYCTHFVTKELDATVFTLLDDLARFQDRMHQKDPVKARVKRRLMYGIKEIKKHLTLKKLKGIIIATDIEDNKTEGGLNDLLRELISLSEAYHIPYVFSHKRFNLGKVCRKPAPVSCVGILNYEGSEKNFKRMLELQEENQTDYTVITKKLIQLLTDDHITSLFDTVQKSVIPYEISKFIMKELFGNDILGDENKNSELTVEPEIESLNLETKMSSPATKLEFSISNKNCELIEDYYEISKIQSILKKYNVIKT